MITIKYSESKVGSCHDKRCTDTSCPTNKLHVPREPFFCLSDVLKGTCPIITDMINDEGRDVVFRAWMKDVYVDKKSGGLPRDRGQLAERVRSQYGESIVKDD